LQQRFYEKFLLFCFFNVNCILLFFLNALEMWLQEGSFSEESDKIGRGFIKILETWQFGISFNIIRHVFFVLAKKIFCRFYEFLKNSGLHKNRKITLLTVNNAFFNRVSWLRTFFKVIWWLFDYYCILRIFVNFWFFTDYFLSDLWPSKRSLKFLIFFIDALLEYINFH
jgi:hypothetical protein